MLVEIILFLLCHQLHIQVATMQHYLFRMYLATLAHHLMRLFL